MKHSDDYDNAHIYQQFRIMLYLALAAVAVAFLAAL